MHSSLKTLDPFINTKIFINIQIIINIQKIYAKIFAKNTKFLNFKVDSDRLYGFLLSWKRLLQLRCYLRILVCVCE